MQVKGITWSDLRLLTFGKGVWEYQELKSGMCNYPVSFAVTQ